MARGARRGRGCGRLGRRAVLALGLLAVSAAKAGAACSLSLVLALDVSSSVDGREYRLQREGLAAALADPAVVEAIAAQGGIWITAFEWSGTEQQFDWLEWTHVEDAGSIGRAAARVAAARRASEGFPTALGYALGHALARLRDAPERCLRQVIDVAGDGVNNHGFPPRSTYRANDMTGITVNGLVIEGEVPPPVPFYRAEVLHGPGAFLEVTASYEDYAEAMRRKLLRELAAQYVMAR
ncbi:DUF1194 domain-containing protein [Rhodobacteraceae bacterium DSL-40]|uniref:DUF1194 domain-containing protein n=1 Tax=Amaricoccus sp. B4 TaxID=3368557 RepID=UPI000DAB686A